VSQTEGINRGNIRVLLARMLQRTKTFPESENTMRKVFFSFAYEDVNRVMIVRNSHVIRGINAAGFLDKADFEAVEREGDAAIARWIDRQLEGTSVTVVLVGEKTCTSKWVQYEIEKSKARGNGLLGIDISKVNAFNLPTTNCCGKIPTGYSFYSWTTQDGYNNMGGWIEAAAKDAGK
jgi:hypothetical protein